MKPASLKKLARAGTLAGFFLFAPSAIFAADLPPLPPTTPSAGGQRQGPLDATVQAFPSAPTTSTLAAAAAKGAGPRIVLDAPVHDFGKVMSGEVVKHTFVFRNTGDQPLEITDVRPSCGCTTARDWSRRVEPGQTGNLPIEFATGNFNGPVTKPVTVTCNDPTYPTLTLQLRGILWRAFDVTPSSASFNGLLEDLTNVVRVVRITNNLTTPVAVFDLQTSRREFAAELKTNRSGVAYEVAVRLAPPLGDGNLFGQVTLKTSSTNMPVITIPTWAIAQRAITVMPAEVTLPAGAITNELKLIVSVRSIWSQPLTLLEPTLNAEGVDVKVQELQPGHYFALTLTFPAGFTIAPGHKTELTFRSNHPQFPVFRVPVIQRAVAIPAGAVRAVPAAALPPPVVPRAAGQ